MAKAALLLNKFVTCLAVVGFCQVSALIPPGAIPLNPGSAPASDLFYEGKFLLPPQARLKQNQGFDLSLLDPDPHTVLWKRPQGMREISFSSQDLNFVESGQRVFFNSYLSNPANFFEYDIKLLFSARQDRQSAKNLVFIAGKYAHSYLLRAALLRRLGYWVPTMKWVKQMTVEFKNSVNRDKFKRRLRENARALERYWITSETDNSLELQDLLVYELDNQKYNLVENFASSYPIQRRRLMNALSIPFELSYVPESVNLYPWTFGRVVHEHLVLNNEGAVHFAGNYEDARWMSRLVLSVVSSRKVAQGIVDEAKFPREVAAVVLEKFIAQRNQLRKLFHLEEDFAEIPTKKSRDINLGPRLQQGKLIADSWDPAKDPWPGYASRFVYGDPKNPLSLEEIWALLKSKFYANVISNGMLQLNEWLPFNTDIAKKARQQDQQSLEKELEHFVRTGENRAIPVDYWSFPYVDFRMIAGRDVVIGSYLGADNYVQQADTLGWEVKAGLYLGASFLPEQWAGFWKNEGFVSHIITHIRPVSSVKQALKTPLKKILVPLSIRKISRLLATFNQAQFEQGTLPEQEQFIEEFNEQLKVGESFVISLRYGLNSLLQAGYALDEDWSLFSQVYGGGLLLARLHIHRKSEREIVIYRDDAKLAKFGVRSEVDFKLPIVGAQWDFSLGNARSRIYKLELFDEEEELNTLSFSVLSEVFRKSYVPLWGVPKQDFIDIRYQFSQSVAKANLLPWVAGKNTRQLDFKIEVPGFAQKYHFKRLRNQYLFGCNYEKLSLDVVNAVIRHNTQEPVVIQSAANGRPADSLWGRAYVKDMYSDVYLDAEGLLDLKYTRIQHRWRGWSADKARSQKFIADINHRVGQPILNDQELTGLDKILFYNFSLDYHIYDQAREYVLALGVRKAKQLFIRHSGDPVVMPASTLAFKDFSEDWYLSDVFNIVYKDFRRAYHQTSVQAKLRAWHVLLLFMEKHLNFAALEELLGKGNVVASAQYGGLVQLGKENGDGTRRYTYSKQLGLYGEERLQGPLEALRNLLGIGPSQFYLDWLMESF